MLPVIGFKVNTLTINLSVLGITDIQHLDVYIDNLSVVSFKEYKNYVYEAVMGVYSLSKGYGSMH
jgi:hypothetical protein